MSDSQGDYLVPKGPAALLPLGLVTAMVGGAVWITQGQDGISKEISEARGEMKQDITEIRGEVNTLRAENRRNHEVLELKVDRVNDRTQSLETMFKDMDDVYLTKKDLRNALLELQAANKDLKIP